MERLESVGVIIVAAGKGLRMGGDIPKQYLPIDGEPMVFRTLERFLRPDISRIILLALLTPSGDAVTLLVAMLPFVLLYELAVLWLKTLDRRKERGDAGP